ncbi:hypothetical protein [Vibrio fluvialis]
MVLCRAHQSSFPLDAIVDCLPKLREAE